MHDLADKNPDVVTKLAKRWQEMAKMDHTTGNSAAPVTDKKPPLLKKDGRPEGGDGVGKAKKKGQGKKKRSRSNTLGSKNSRINRVRSMTR
jgi:hypothetical protein